MRGITSGEQQIMTADGVGIHTGCVAHPGSTAFHDMEPVASLVNIDPSGTLFYHRWAKIDIGAQNKAGRIRTIRRITNVLKVIQRRALVSADRRVLRLFYRMMHSLKQSVVQRQRAGAFALRQ